MDWNIDNIEQFKLTKTEELNRLYNAISDHQNKIYCVINTPKQKVQLDNLTISDDHSMVIEGVKEVKKERYFIFRDQALNMECNDDTKYGKEFKLDEDCYPLKFDEIINNFHSITYCLIRNDFRVFTTCPIPIDMKNEGPQIVRFTTDNDFFVIINPIEVFHPKRDRDYGNIRITLCQLDSSGNTSNTIWIEETMFNHSNYSFTNKIELNETINWLFSMEYVSNPHDDYCKQEFVVSFRSKAEIIFN